MNKRSLARLLALLFISVSLLSDVHANGTSLPKKSTLPTLFFKDSVTADTMKYLGLSRKRAFSVDDMRGSLFIIEVFSTYCTSCPKNVPVLNGVYEALRKDAEAKREIRVFGIAIGNTDREVKSYREAHRVLFPVLTDYDFSVHDALGSPRVPYTLYVKKTPKGSVIVSSHQGLLDSAESVLKKVSTLQ